MEYLSLLATQNLANLAVARQTIPNACALATIVLQRRKLCAWIVTTKNRYDRNDRRTEVATFSFAIENRSYVFFV